MFNQKLLRRGDIEESPELASATTEQSKFHKNHHDRLKPVTMNCQNLKLKLNAMKTMRNSRSNTKYTLFGTWLQNEDDNNLWSFDRHLLDRHLFFATSKVPTNSKTEVF